MSSKPWNPMNNSPMDIRPPFPSDLTHYYLILAWVWLAGVLLIHPNEWNLTVRHRGCSNHHIFLMLWVDSNHLHPELSADSNHLPPELSASAITTDPLNSLLNKIHHTYAIFFYLFREKVGSNELQPDFMELFRVFYLKSGILLNLRYSSATTL